MTGSKIMTFGFRDYLAMLKKRGFRLPLTYFFQAHLFDLMNGTDTHIWLPKEHYQDQPENIGHGVLYMASWTNIIKATTRRSLSKFRLTASEVRFVDIGCGRGKVLCVWARLFGPKASMVGVEYGASLIETCGENLSYMGHAGADLRAIDACQLRLEQQDLVTLVYLYNPFDDVILKQVVERLTPHRCLIIYNNPVHLEVLIQNGFEVFAQKSGWHPNSDYALLANFAPIDPSVPPTPRAKGARSS